MLLEFLDKREIRMKKYNWKLFWLGFLMNLMKKFFLFIPGLVLCIIGIWINPCLYIGIALFVFDAVISYAEQWQMKKTVESNDNPDFQQWADIMTQDDWQEEIKKAINDRIENLDNEDCD